MSLGRDFALSLILGLRNLHEVLCHLFRCFDPRFNENAHCHPVFIIRDINSYRKGYLKDRLKSRESDHFNIQFVMESQTLRYSPLQKREGTGRVSYIDWIENLNVKTEILMNEKLPDQV